MNGRLRNVFPLYMLLHTQLPFPRMTVSISTLRLSSKDKGCVMPESFYQNLEETIFKRGTLQ